MAGEGDDRERGLSRRQVLGSGAAAATSVVFERTDAAAAARPAGRPHRRPRRAHRRADVVVVGAGISGLTAARRLVRSGVRSVLVLEASRRVGGRTLNLPVADGVITEGGGQWVGPGQDRVLALIKELGLSTFKTYVEGGAIYMQGGDRQTYSGAIPPLSSAGLADYAEVQGRLQQMASTVPVAAPWTARDALQWDGTTFGQWLDANSRSDETKRVLMLGFSLINGEDLHNTSLLFVLFRIAASGGLDRMLSTSGGAQDSRVVGGSQLISLRMAGQLGDQVMLGSPVTEIERSGRLVLVKSRRAHVRCKRVIVAMTPADADRIRFKPDLPVRRAVLQRHWHNGSGTKAAAVYKRPFWREAGLSGQALTDLPCASYVVDNSPPDGRLGILLTFIGTAGGGHGLKFSDAILNDRAARRAAVLNSLTTLFGSKAGRPIRYLEKAWVHEPWIDGCESTRAPGVLTQYTDAALEPVGPIHWAGTESASVNEGYMDGAVRAGERAAREVRRAL